MSAGVAEVKLAAKNRLRRREAGRARGGGGGGSAGLPVAAARGAAVGGGPTDRSRAATDTECVTIGNLQGMSTAALAPALGSSQAAGLRALAFGEDPRGVMPDEVAKSVGVEETFAEDLSARAELERELLGQAVRLGRRLRAAGLKGRVVTLKVKYSNFSLVTRRGTLSRSSDDDRTLYEASRKQLDRVDLGRPVRLTGISVSDFVGTAEPPSSASSLRQGGKTHKERMTAATRSTPHSTPSPIGLATRPWSGPTSRGAAFAGAMVESTRSDNPVPPGPTDGQVWGTGCQARAASGPAAPRGGW